MPTSWGSMIAPEGGENCVQYELEMQELARACGVEGRFNKLCRKTWVKGAAKRAAGCTDQERRGERKEKGGEETYGRRLRRGRRTCAEHVMVVGRGAKGRRTYASW